MLRLDSPQSLGAGQSQGPLVICGKRKVIKRPHRAGRKHEVSCITWELLNCRLNRMKHTKKKRKLPITTATGQDDCQAPLCCLHRPPELAENESLHAKHFPLVLVKQERG